MLDIDPEKLEKIKQQTRDEVAKLRQENSCIITTVEAPLNIYHLKKEKTND